MPAAIEVERRQVLAYRAAAHQLDRSAASLDDLALVDLGVQDTPAGSAAIAIAARVRGPEAPAGLDGDDHALVWSIRGAPHYHRRGELRRVAAGVRALRDDDACRATADAMRRVVKGRTTKGDVSAAITRELPSEFSTWCGPCGVTHIHESLFRRSALVAGLRVVPRSVPVTFEPLPRWRPPAADPSETTRLIATYLRFLGPAAKADVAAWLWVKPGELAALWPADAVEVRVDGRKRWVASGAVEELTSADRPRDVRLLPPHDPYLQARDRELLVPRAERRKALFTSAATSPGAVVVDAEVVGTWRARGRGKRTEVVVQPFDPLTAKAKAAVEHEAAIVASVRGTGDVSVSYLAA